MHREYIIRAGNARGCGRRRPYASSYRKLEWQLRQPSRDRVERRHLRRAIIDRPRFGRRLASCAVGESRIVPAVAGGDDILLA